MRPYILASVMDCDCSEQQAQRIECYNCNPLSCICEEGDSVICLFCEREYLFIQSDHDIQSIISEEDCPSLSSGAGANSVIQSPQQYDDLSKTFSHNLPTTNGGADDLTCFEVADDPGEGTSGLSGNVSRPCSKSDGYTKGREEPLLIMSNICSRPLKTDVISAMEVLKIKPVKILTQENAAKIVDFYLDNDHLPRFLQDVVLGQYHHRQRYHQAQMDLATAQAEVAVTPSNQEWYMQMTDMKHLNKARFLKTKEQLDQEAGPAQPKRSNPYQVIQNIKKAKLNKLNTGHTTNVPQPMTVTEEDPFSDDQEFLQTLNDSEVQVEIPASSSPIIQEMNTPTVISSLVVLLEGVQEVCAGALLSLKQLQSK